VGDMTTKHPSRLAASGPADDPDSEQITKEHSDDDGVDDITVDPSSDVTVEASEDVTIEAASRTPHPTLASGGAATPGTVGVSAGQRAPTLLGVPINSLPLPGLTSAATGASSDSDEDATRSISYDEEVTVLAPPAAADPLAMLDALDRPSITDDDEEETKVEPAEAAMKAAESSDDVTTALSAQASLEREKALRRSAPPASSPTSADLEFADPEADDEEEESLDDELDDDDEVISAGGAVEEEEDDDGATDGVATATFMKPADSTGLSGLLNPRRPPTGNPYGRDGFGGRLPTPYPPPQTTIPAPSTSPFASRLGPAPSGSPYAARPTGASIPAIQVPPPSGKATTESDPGFFMKPVSMPAWMLILLVGGGLLAGSAVGSAIGHKSAPPAPTVIVAKPTAPTVAPAPPVVEPVGGSAPAAGAGALPAGAQPNGTEVKPATAGTTTPSEAAATATAKVPAPTAAPTVTDIGTPPSDTTATGDEPLPKLAKKPAAAKPHKVAIVTEPSGDDGAAKSATPKPAVATAKPAAPKPAVAVTPKPAAAKPGKKAAKAWVDPFAN